MKIKDYELMKGNHVIHKGVVCEVLEISDDWLQLDNDQLNTEIKEVEPLVLTEDVLDKFGWKWDIKHQGFWNGSYKITENGLGAYRFHIDRKVYYLGFAHELQNLYLVLERERLSL